MAYRGILNRIRADPLVRSFAEVPDIDRTMASLLSTLDGCQTALYQFLELKRSQFPRCVRIQAQ